MGCAGSSSSPGVSVVGRERNVTCSTAVFPIFKVIDFRKRRFRILVTRLSVTFDPVNPGGEQ